MSTAQPTTTLEPTQFDQIRPALSRRQLRIILFIIAGIVLLPLLYVFAQREVARWYQASMQDAIYRHDNETALEKCEAALGWDPSNLELLAAKSHIYLSMAKAKEAAATADQSLILARINYEGRPSRYNKQQLVSALNRSAYSHALAGTKLEQSLEYADEALGYLASGMINSGILDTRGYLHYLLGNDEQAMHDMELAVAVEETNYRDFQTSKRIESRGLIDKSRVKYEQQSARESMSVFYQHRGLAYDRIGESEKADEDLKRAQRMGYDPANGVW
ncbi:MAG: hypothetical protein AAF497_04530 [Planctomycetota bacterium]